MADFNSFDYLRAQSVIGIGMQLKNKKETVATKKLNKRCSNISLEIIAKMLVYKLEHNMSPVVTFMEIEKLSEIIGAYMDIPTNNSLFNVNRALGTIEFSGKHPIGDYIGLGNRVPFSTVLSITRLLS